MLALLFILLSPMTVGPTWEWPEERIINPCDNDDWDAEEAALERFQRCAQREAEEDGIQSFAWGG